MYLKKGQKKQFKTPNHGHFTKGEVYDKIVPGQEKGRVQNESKTIHGGRIRTIKKKSVC